MSRRAWYRVLAASLLAFIAMLFWLGQEAALPEGKRNTRIAVVLYGDSSNRWRSFDQGIAQACGELNIERPIISYAPVGDAGRQAYLLRREIESGLDGLLVAAVDDVAIADYLDGLEVRPAVVMVDSGAGAVASGGADDAHIGRMLSYDFLSRYDDRATVYGGRTRERCRLCLATLIA